jgi:hypothetical protein
VDVLADRADAYAWGLVEFHWESAYLLSYEDDPGNPEPFAAQRREGSYAPPAGKPGRWWVNIRSRARGLLALFLFTDVGRHDAPTRLLCGSHLAVPQFLAPYGEAGTGSP